MSTIANKIRPKVAKVINKFPTVVEILRDDVNEFGEPAKSTSICTVKGFYHEGNNMVSTSISDKGEDFRGKQNFLMVIYDETTISIKENDYFYLDDIKYRIKDKGNQNRLNIYFDMLIEVN